MTDTSSGKSVDTRVNQGSLGHHDIWNSTASGGGLKTIEEVVANYNTEDNVIQFPELQQAISWWVQEKKVPNTGGKKIDFPKLQQLINLWVQGTEV